jgi:hypothetical protein
MAAIPGNRLTNSASSMIRFPCKMELATAPTRRSLNLRRARPCIQSCPRLAHAKPIESRFASPIAGSSSNAECGVGVRS